LQAATIWLSDHGVTRVLCRTRAHDPGIMRALTSPTMVNSRLHGWRIRPLWPPWTSLVDAVSWHEPWHGEGAGKRRRRAQAGLQHRACQDRPVVVARQTQRTDDADSGDGGVGDGGVGCEAGAAAAEPCHGLNMTDRARSDRVTCALRLFIELVCWSARRATLGCPRDVPRGVTHRSAYRNRYRCGRCTARSPRE
jgi:hypothetical protein